MNAQDTANAWSGSGYVTEIPYTRDYMRYQAPINMAFAAAANGFEFPDYKSSFRYCDLGCGEAITTLCLAAAYPHGTFVGVDLNPEHIRNAQILANEAGLTNVSFLEADFADPRIAELGPFEFVGCHGVYSWVSPSIQSQLHALIENLMADGGLFYFCHYVRPGAQRTESLFQLVQSLMDGIEGPVSHKVTTAVGMLSELRKQDTPFFDNISGLGRVIKELNVRDVRYLVHEYGNKYFYPRYFPEVNDDLTKIGMHHVGTTRWDRLMTSSLFEDKMPSSLEGLDHTETEIQSSLLSYDEFRWDVFRKRPKGETAPKVRPIPISAGPRPLPIPFPTAMAVLTPRQLRSL